MKRILAATTALAMTLTGSMASAQNWHHGDRGGHHDRGDRGRDRGGRHGGWHGDRHRGDYGRYARGQRYRGDGVYLSDYGRYGYRRPPRGYRYYRTNDGDIVLAAVATGIIASVIANNSRGY